MLKKIMLKGMALFFVFSVCLLSTTNAFATDTLIIEKNLLSRGYPQQVLNGLCDEAKEEIFLSNSIFEEATLQCYDEQTGEASSLQFKAGQTPIMPYGQIQTKHLALTWVISQGTRNKKLITFNYNWTQLPLNRWQDPIGISWDANKLYLETGSFHKVDKFTFRNGSSAPLYTGVQSDEWAYANGGANGVTWYADLKGHSGSMPVYGLYGYATFTLIPKTQTGSSQLFSHYVHAKLSNSLAMAIPGFGSFSVSGGSFYDELGNQREIYWGII